MVISAMEKNKTGNEGRNTMCVLGGHFKYSGQEKPYGKECYLTKIGSG